VAVLAKGFIVGLLRERVGVGLLTKGFIVGVTLGAVLAAGLAATLTAPPTCPPPSLAFEIREFPFISKISIVASLKSPLLAS
jgi:hypothetical protein